MFNEDGYLNTSFLENEEELRLELSQCVECVLIISGSFGKEVVPKYHDFLCIKEILIFTMRKDLHEEWASHYDKIKGIFDSIEEVNDAMKDIDFNLKTYEIYV